MIKCWYVMTIETNKDDNIVSLCETLEDALELIDKYRVENKMFSIMPDYVMAGYILLYMSE